MSATGKPKNVLTVSYVIIGFYHKDFTIATIYDKLQRIDLAVSKSTNINNTIIKNGEAFGIKQLYHDLGRSRPTNFAKHRIEGSVCCLFVVAD